MAMYRIDTGYAVGGIEEYNGRITKTAPIFYWMRGKTINFVYNWCNRKGYEVIKLWR